MGSFYKSDEHLLPFVPFRTPVNLLSRDEQWAIQELGLPVDFLYSMITFDADRKIIWSVKAIQAVKAACSYYGANEPFKTVVTERDLFYWGQEFHLQVDRFMRAEIDKYSQGLKHSASQRALVQAEKFGTIGECLEVTMRLRYLSGTGVSLLSKKR